MGFYRELWASLGEGGAYCSSSLRHRLHNFRRLVKKQRNGVWIAPPSAFAAAGERIRDALPAAASPDMDGLAAGASYLNRRLYQDVTSGLLSTLLKYDDKMGMAFSVECRVPFLDHRLVELLFSLSPFEKMHHGWTKKLLRDAMEGIVPEPIQWCSEKTPFPMPVKRWFRSEMLDWAEERILDGEATGRGYLDRANLESLLKDHRAQRFDISRSIWQWLCLSVWFEINGKLPDRSLAAPR